MPQITIIIPVYNVAPYLRKCLDSVLSQTLREIEIILVDDGSTDGSGEIADEYANRDERIKVFHTENHGLSAARNLGIDHSSGDWLMFVDSDDWVEPGFCEIPLTAANTHTADLVIFMANKDGQQMGFKSPSIPDGVTDPKIAVNNSGSFAWNKLYKRELFDGVYYPEGKVYEDMAVTHKIVMRAERIALISDVLYHYGSREGSIGGSRNEEYRRDGFEAAVQRFEDLKELGCEPDYSTLLYFTIGYLSVVKPSDDPVYKKAVEIADSVKEIPAGLNRKRKMLLKVWKVNPGLFHTLCRIFRQKDSRQ